MKIHLLQKQLPLRNIVDSQIVSTTFAAFTSQPSALPTDPAGCSFCPFKCLKWHQRNQSKGVVGAVKTSRSEVESLESWTWFPRPQKRNFNMSATCSASTMKKATSSTNIDQLTEGYMLTVGARSLSIPARHQFSSLDIHD